MYYSVMRSRASRQGVLGPKQRWGLALGPAVALALLLWFNPDPANPAIGRTAAVAALMAIWWITEAIPIPATALLPVALFPVLGVMAGKATASTYFNYVIFLFIGGFVMALAMQRWQLHRRIALRVVMLIGTSPKKLILGFMVATAFLSMWISNTATTMMMVPIAMAVIANLRERNPDMLGTRFGAGLLIGIAYAASTGGIATLIGTPPNLSFSRIFHIFFESGPEISFAAWFVFALPISLLMTACAWLVLVRMFAPRHPQAKSDRAIFREELAALGPMSFEEKVVASLFTVMSLLWLTRKSIALGSFVIPGWSQLLPAPAFVDDGTIAIFVALVLFLIPSRQHPGTRLMNWRTAVGLPWGIVLLFGGGFALASGFKESGLSEWIAGQLVGLSSVPSVVLVSATSTVMTFLTELTSNTATTEMVLPLLASLATAIKVNPLLLMIPATLSASCAFMLPVATPPNAIVFGSGEIKMGDMIRAGLIMNFVGVVLVTAAVYLVGLVVFGISPDSFPAWAVPAP